MANMRRKGDAEADKALLAQIHKLIGNAIYGKYIEAVVRQTKVLYTTDEDEVDKHLPSAYFEVLEEIGDAYKIESRKNKVTINQPFQVGIVAYQLAKLRMLQFYYDFLDKYIDRRDYELIQMDTDSMYFALSYDTLEEAVKPELKQDFANNKKQWLSWDKWSNREPGLFKLEKEGTRAIALCSKCYFVEDEKSGKAKMSSKGVSQRQNKLQWSRYEQPLDGVQGHGHKQGLQDEGRGDVHLQTAQAWSERLLRQALGVGRRHPHGADGVPHNQLNKGISQVYPQHGTWAQRCNDNNIKKGLSFRKGFHTNY